MHLLHGSALVAFHGGYLMVEFSLETCKCKKLIASGGAIQIEVTPFHARASTWSGRARGGNIRNKKE